MNGITNLVGVAKSTFDAVAFHLSDPQRQSLDNRWLAARLPRMTDDQLDQLVRSLVYRRMRGGFRVPQENIDLIIALRGARP